MSDTSGLAERKPTQIELVKQFFERDNVKSRFAEMLGKRAPQFLTSVLQIVASNDLLKNADVNSIYNAAATAATLDLPLNNNLGFAYIVPYNQSYVDGKDDKGKDIWKKRQLAQLQIGYKGFLQLALRSRQFKTIGAAPIYEGQLISENPLTGFEFDFKAKTSDKIIGYAAYFRLLDGFEKTLYATCDQLTKHGKKYSQTFKSGKGLWDTDFDAMATKTVIKLLLSKYAPLSVEMQRAVISDQAIINDTETMDVEYVDNMPLLASADIDKEHERIEFLISEATCLKDLEAIGNIPESLIAAFEARKALVK